MYISMNTRIEEWLQELLTLTFLISFKARGHVSVMKGVILQQDTPLPDASRKIVLLCVLYIPSVTHPELSMFKVLTIALRRFTIIVQSFKILFSEITSF
jgi:hypothetical protein